ncbi:MAG: ABC transporter permease, partial [Enterococcus thailandicus]|nr:ABC transporter permease [Enterococcus thailandicus]
FMMVIYYIVFSTIFKSDTANFPVYLIIGIVCFNFFSEATNMALHSIVGNASLITKVYMPKYIFPVSRVLSSTVNLLLSLVPLFLVLLYTKTNLSIRFILIIFGLICLVVLCLGVGMILSSSMVFFRDTQFLWGVIITMLNFGTPIFYPENIIPRQFMPLFKMNPLYQIIRFIRIVIIDGISPEPKAYLLCIVTSMIPLLLGIYVFKKTQDKFILNL